MVRFELPDWPLNMSTVKRRQIERTGTTQRRLMGGRLMAFGQGFTNDQLRGLAIVLATVEEEIRSEVDRRRSFGTPWSEIGDSLGVSKQAAQQRYGVVTID